MTAFIRLPVLVAALLFAAAIAAQPAPGAPPRLIQSDDPRVRNLAYHFADTGEEMPYSLFVSSKVSDDKPNPLIVVLHGLGIGPGFMMRGSILDLAEEGGYIVVSPMGYNAGGWWGSPVITRNNAPPEPANLAELSEKDMLNVLAMIREQFNVDENRTYLMGHSMGGAGTLFLGVKHAANWAALAPIAPAAFRLDPASLDPVKDSMPIIVVQGDADELVPAANTRLWIDWMEANGMKYKYIELAGAGHGDVIEKGMADIFAFFAEHTRKP